ncbi:MAG TPA: YIP1 family protein [Vicinamibacterales bacterium]
MANTSVETGAVPAPKNLVARFVGIITSPKATFESVVAHPKWLGMLVVTTVIVAVCTTLPMTTEAGKEAALDRQVKQMESFGMKVDDVAYERMQKQMAYTPYITAVSILVMSPLMTVIFSGIVFAIFNAAMGGTASFKQVMAVWVHAGAISALGQLFTGPMNYFRGTMTSATNLAALLPMLPETSFVGKLAGMIDLFAIWWVIVLAMGIAVLYRRKTQPIAIAFFSLYAVIALGVAAFMSRGGTN